MEAKYNNTAGRLLALFQAARNHLPAVRNDQVWLHVLGVLPDTLNKSPRALTSPELAQIYQRLVPLQSGLAEVESDIKEARPTDSHLYLVDFDQLMRVVAPNNIQGQWVEGKKLLSDRALHCLEMCANELPKEGELSRDELEELANAVNELFNDVKNSSIRNPLKRWILSLLSAIRKSIDNYHVFGAKGLKQSFSTIVGELVIHADARKEVEKEHAGVWTDLVNVYCKLYVIASKAKEWWPLLQAGGKLIGISFLDEGGIAPTSPTE